MTAEDRFGPISPLTARAVRAVRRDRAPDYSTTATLRRVGPQGARDDYENAVKIAGGVLVYDIDALVARDDTVAAAWTGHLPNGSDYRGLSLYRVVNGLLPRSAIP